MSGIIWTKKKIRGVVYDLRHLNPFLLDVVPGADGVEPLKVLVSFDIHTVTRERFPADTPDLFFGENGDPRSFDATRYGCSLLLPDLLRKGAKGNVYFSHQDKYLMVGNIPLVSGEYATVFALRPSKMKGVDARMFVISAHERRNPLGQMEAISFFTLVRNIANGHPPRGQKTK